MGWVICTDLFFV